MRTEAITALEKAFITGWGSPGLFPVQMNNQPFTKPDGLPWGRLSLVLGDRTPAEISTQFSRTLGVLTLQVFLPDDTGDRQAHAAADKIDAVFRFRTFQISGTGFTGTVFVEAGAGGPIEAGSRDGYVQKNVQLPVRIDDYVTP